MKSLVLAVALCLGLAASASACDVACSSSVAVVAAPVVQSFAVQSYAVPSVALVATPVVVEQVAFVHHRARAVRVRHCR